MYIVLRAIAVIAVTMISIRIILNLKFVIVMLIVVSKDDSLTIIFTWRIRITWRAIVLLVATRVRLNETNIYLPY